MRAAVQGRSGARMCVQRQAAIPQPGVGSAFEADGLLTAAGDQGHGNLLSMAEADQIVRRRHGVCLDQQLSHNRLLNR